MLYEYKIITDVDEKIYGIAVFDNDALVDIKVSVSSSKENIFDLIRRCNELQLSPVHLNDVISDELCK